MKSLLVAVCLAFGFSFASGVAEARTGGPLGAGVILGDPTGLTVKYDATEISSYDAGLAFNFDRWILVYGDYHYNFPNAFQSQSGVLQQFVPYVGVGLVAVFSNRPELETRGFKYFDSSSSSRFALGLRIPLGIEWRPTNAPLGIFAEIVPGMTIIPATYAFAQGGLGIRYYF